MTDSNRVNISTKEQFENVCQPLIDSIGFIKEFANSIKAEANYSSYHHDWPVVEINFRSKFNDEKKYHIDKTIFFTISDYKYPPIYILRVVVSNNYGPKELLALIPGISKKRDLWKRYRWEKIIGYLRAPIDKNNLLSLLNEATQILSNFDESELKEISR